MKKMIKYLFMLGILLVPFTNLKAATGVFDIYASPKEVNVGGSTTVTVYCKSDVAEKYCEYTLSYDSSKLQFLGANDSTNCNGSVCKYIASETSSGKSFNFKVIASGSSTVSVMAAGMIEVVSEAAIATSTDPVTITGVIPTPAPTPGSSGGSSTTRPSTSVTYSTNNYLSSLGIDGYTLDKEFNKETDTYSITVEPNIEKINITATPEDSKSQIAGTGEKTVTEGNNKFEIIVTSEKGTTKTYILNVNVKDENPIEVKINNETFTIIKRLTSLTKPNACTEGKVTIKDKEIPVYKCENTNYTLIGLKDTNGISNLYIYNEKNNTYTLYNEISFQSLTIGILDTAETLKGYTKMKTQVNGSSVMGFKTDSLSAYTLLYGINIETGEKNWYLYEQTENTIQKFDIDGFNTTTKQVKNAKMLIYGFGGITALLTILLIFVSINSTKIKSKKTAKIILDKPNDKKVEVKEKIKEEPKTEEKKKEKKKSKPDIFDGL